jgi:hypothetical protein
LSCFSFLTLFFCRQLAAASAVTTALTIFFLIQGVTFYTSDGDEAQKNWFWSSFAFLIVLSKQATNPTTYDFTEIRVRVTTSVTKPRTQDTYIILIYELNYDYEYTIMMALWITVYGVMYLCIM